MIDEFEYHLGHCFQVLEYPDDDYPSVKYYYYRIYDGEKVAFESSNEFEAEQEARFAAIGHIVKLIDAMPR